jgi:hypothetical protein
MHHPPRLLHPPPVFQQPSPLPPRIRHLAPHQLHQASVHQGFRSALLFGLKLLLHRTQLPPLSLRMFVLFCPFYPRAEAQA